MIEFIIISNMLVILWLILLLSNNNSTPSTFSKNSMNHLISHDVQQFMNRSTQKDILSGSASLFRRSHD